jgi:L-malate glycosyltransferase
LGLAGNLRSFCQCRKKEIGGEMKVLFFSHQSDFIYGGEICTLSFMQELSANGVEVHFAAPKGKYLERARDYARVHEVSSMQFQRSITELPKIPSQFFRTYKELKNIVKNEKISVLHATSLKAMAYLAFFPKITKTIWHHHDILKKKLDNDLWMRLFSSRSDLILVPSNASLEEFHRLHISKAKVLHNGFSVSGWSRRVFRKSNIFRIGLVGEISKRKGADRWENIFKIFSDKYKDVEFVIIGEGLSDPAFAKNVRDSLFGLPVKFLGRKENMREQYAELDVILVLSKQDPLPTVIIEAGFSGVPAIGTKVGGIPELIEDGKSGYLVSSDSEVVAALDKLRDSELWKKMSEESHQKMKKEFSIEILTKNLMKLYEQYSK